MSLRVPIAVPVILCALVSGSLAAAGPVKRVTHNLVKVGIEKVVRVSLAPQQPADGKKRQVIVTAAATYPKCSGGEAYAFAEGTWDKVDYISYWASEADGCPAGGPVDIQHVMTLDVGKNYSFVFRGPGKFDQKVGFRVDEDKVASVLIKKILQR